MYAKYNQRFLKDNVGRCGRSFVLQHNGREQLHFERISPTPLNLMGFVNDGGNLNNAPRGHRPKDFEKIEKELKGKSYG